MYQMYKIFKMYQLYNMFKIYQMYKMYITCICWVDGLSSHIYLGNALIRV